MKVGIGEGAERDRMWHGSEQRGKEIQGEVCEIPWTSQSQEDPHNSEEQPEKKGREVSDPIETW